MCSSCAAYVLDRRESTGLGCTVLVGTGDRSCSGRLPPQPEPSPQVRDVDSACAKEPQVLHLLFAHLDLRDCAAYMQPCSLQARIRSSRIHRYLWNAAKIWQTTKRYITFAAGQRTKMASKCFLCSSVKHVDQFAMQDASSRLWAARATGMELTLRVAVVDTPHSDEEWNKEP